MAAAERRQARSLDWREPVEVAAALADHPWSAALLSDGVRGRWSYVMAEPDRTDVVPAGDPRDGLALLRDMLGPRRPAGPGAPFQGGVLGLLAYEYAARLEALSLPRDPDWPDLALARYPTVLAFDHRTGTVEAYGDPNLAAQWLAAPAPSAPRGALASCFNAEAPRETYEAAVADVVARIAAGEIFQANIARAWSGRLAPKARPFDLVRRLAGESPAPFAAWWRLPGLALASNSPERFVAVEPAADGGFSVETRPIKGTRPRGAGLEDARLKAELLASEKDRAENLMIVDLMRNDLSRVCRPGQVTTPELFRVESYANVHHLVSTVTGQLAEGKDAADLLAAAFPPGSITGAPKVQAMRTIALHEGPRGPWCGSLFRAGFDGGLDSSVLIRTVAFVEDESGWRFRALAGAGVVADSEPVAERLETEAKLAAIAHALGTPS